MIVTQWISVHVVIIPTCSRIFFFRKCDYYFGGLWCIPMKGYGYETIVFCIVNDAGIIHTGADGEQGIKICKVLGKSDLTPAIGKDDVGIDGRNYKAIDGYCHAVVGRYIVALDIAIKIHPNGRFFSRSAGGSK